MSNPKDLIGRAKVALSYLSSPALLECCLGLFEGGHKYGRHNYRQSQVDASIYYDAAMRHLFLFWEGEDIDPDSGLPHITKAMSSLAVLRDAQIFGTCHDDRPPPMPSGWMDNLNEKAAAITSKYPVPIPPVLAKKEK